MENMIPEMRAEMSGMAVEVREVIRRLPGYAKLTWLLVKDPSLTAKQRAVLLAAVGYSVSPVDVVPGFIPVIGQLDDLAVVLYSLRWILGSLGDEKQAEYLRKSGLTAEILDEDLDLVRRSGVKVLRRMVKIMGVTALFVYGAGKAAAKEVRRRLADKETGRHGDGETKGQGG